jgi:hypothetical protein
LPATPRNASGKRVNLGRDTSALATVDLRLLHPLMQRLRNPADFLRDRHYRRPAGRVVAQPLAGIAIGIGNIEAGKPRASRLLS